MKVRALSLVAVCILQFSTVVSHFSFLQCAHIVNCNFVEFCRETGSTGAESQPKTLKSLIRNISSGLPTSPMLGRKASHQTSSGIDRLYLCELNAVIEIG